MAKSKVCILAAGKGTRLGEYTRYLNKAMLPLHGKAMISHIIENFPKDSHFVIALGYKGETVKNYLELAHSDLNITFAEVANFDGPGSGPGTSLLSCKEQLGDSPFYFVTCDTYWKKPVTEMPGDKSWMATDFIDQSKIHHYCIVEKTDQGKITNLILKKSSQTHNEVFTGLAFVLETDLFWNTLESSQLDLGEKQVTEPFSELARQGKLFTTPIQWTDVGLKENYQDELKKEGQYDFSKVQEALYMVNRSVIKFFDDAEVADQRVKKAALNPGVFPQIIGQRKNMYQYGFVPGRTLYEEDRPEIFSELLKWLNKNLWTSASVDKSILQKICKDFYQDKTYARVLQFQKKYSDYNVKTINGIETPSTDELLKNVNWAEFTSGVPSFIHGDLQPDNIIYNADNGRFILLDWRHNFGGEVAFGDLYYDFAKLWGGLNLNYKEIKNNVFSYSESGTSCSFKFPRHRHFPELRDELEALALSKNLSVDRIRLLVGIIYLNMSPLHHYPFDKMLHAMGREILAGFQRPHS